MTVELSDPEIMRYNRQIVLRGFDFEGQEALKAASVLVVGLGGLGCAAAQYLAAAGVGRRRCWILIPCRCQISSARRCTAMRRLDSRRWILPARRWRASTPTFSSP